MIEKHGFVCAQRAPLVLALVGLLVVCGGAAYRLRTWMVEVGEGRMRNEDVDREQEPKWGV